MEELSMKVKVHFAQPTILVKQEVYEAEQAEFERLFQENKDLRVSEAHLRDNIACLEAQIKAWGSKYATVCADRDNLEAAYKQVQESLTQMVRNFNETRKELENEVKRVCKEKQDLYTQLADKDEEIEALQCVAEENEERKDEITELRDENCNLVLKLESAEKVIDSLETQLTRAELHNTALESRLEEVLSKFAELQIEFNELNENYDELANAKREYAEEINRLRNENKGLRHQMPLPEFMRQFIEMTREAVKNEFPDSGNS
jgi:chromosome segregation ATPase